MINKFYLRFWGNYGLFTDPLHPVERQTYPIPTHSALRNAIGSIFWRPEMHMYGGTGYQITRVAVKKPISTMSLTRNEVTQVIKRGFKPIYTNVTRDDSRKIKGVRTQRNSVILRDLDYVVEFYINFPDGEFTRTDGHVEINTRVKYENQLIKRLNSFACYRQPYFGCKEFSAYYEQATENDMNVQADVVPHLKIDNMLYEVLNLEKISEISPTFATIEVKNSIITYPTWEQIK